MSSVPMFPFTLMITTPSIWSKKSFRICVPNIHTCRRNSITFNIDWYTSDTSQPLLLISFHILEHSFPNFTEKHHNLSPFIFRLFFIRTHVHQPYYSLFIFFLPPSSLLSHPPPSPKPPPSLKLYSNLQSYQNGQYSPLLYDGQTKDR